MTRSWWTRLRDGPGQVQIIRTADPERDADAHTTAEGLARLEHERRSARADAMLSDPVEIVDLVCFYGSPELDEALGEHLRALVARGARTPCEHRLVHALRACAMAEVTAREGED